MNTLNSSTII